jgi:hypothetical protein
MFIHLDTLVHLSSTRNPDSIGTPIPVPHPPVYTGHHADYSSASRSTMRTAQSWVCEPARRVSTFGSPFTGPSPRERPRRKDGRCA